jgi:hypothetical protein
MSNDKIQMSKEIQEPNVKNDSSELWHLIGLDFEISNQEICKVKMV